MESDMLAGVRLLDKCREGNEIWRIEVWTKIAKEDDPSMQKIKSHLQTSFVDELILKNGGEIVKFKDIGWSAHKCGGHEKRRERPRQSEHNPQ